MKNGSGKRGGHRRGKGKRPIIGKEPVLGFRAEAGKVLKKGGWRRGGRQQFDTQAATKKRQKLETLKIYYVGEN